MLLLLFLTGCGGPSPWANISGQFYSGLTAKSLDRLDGAGDDFSPFSVGFIADPQVVPGYLRLASHAIDYRKDISFSLIVGDLTDRSLRTEFFWVAKVVERSRRPIMTVVGNHDGLIYGEKIYEEIFGDLNYSFIFRGIKFIMWNNNPFEWGYPDFKWLHREIEEHPKVIIVAHQAPGRLERYEEANDEFKAVYDHPHVLGSVHGHTHSDKYDVIADKPVVTVGRVIGTTFTIMHVKDDMKLEFERCKGKSCQMQK